MRNPGLGRLRQFARAVKNVLVPPAIVLLYHRVAESPSDPQLLSVSPKRFAEHLDVLQKFATPIALRQLAPVRQNGKLPRHAVAITFDDGYADNLYNAKPLLERYETPATVFVATGHIGSENEFWYDDLERMLLQPGALPEVLRLEVNGKHHQWQLGTAVHYDEDTYRACHGWSVAANETPTPRHELYRSLFRLLFPLPDVQRRKLMDELLTWASVDLKGRPSHRVLSAEEIVALNGSDKLIEVGSHTVSHSVLSQLPQAAQVQEIVQSKTSLEEILRHSVTSFAYPYGNRSHYTEATVRAVRDAGFECACSNFAGTVRRNTDRWQLPRFLVRDWNGEEFAQRLFGWFRS